MGERTMPWLQPSRARRIVPVVAGPLALLLVVLAVRWWDGTRDATARARSELRAAEADIGDVEDELAAAETVRRGEAARLADELATLAARRDERDAVREGLDSLLVTLTDLEAQLSLAKADLEDRQARLAAFDRCLLGVAQALNQASVADVDGLADTVGAIEGACTAAGVTL
jgi:septal ring factor EnvC (AmiA/AmiB activator)